MKTARLAVVLVLTAGVCIAVGEDEIPGWKAATGHLWSYDAKKEEIKGEKGNLASTTFPVCDFDMDFRICIDDYTDPHNMAGVSFRAAGLARYKLSFRSPNRVMFDKSFAKGNEAAMTILVFQSITIPKGKWIPVQLTVRGGKFLAKIGASITLKATDPDPLTPGTLELSVFNATARFVVKKLTVKTK